MVKRDTVPLLTGQSAVAQIYPLHDFLWGHSLFRASPLLPTVDETVM